MLSGKQLSSHLRVALRHEVLVHKATTLACVTWDVLLANLVGRTTDPVDTRPGAVAIDVGVNVLACWETACLLKMAGQLQSVELGRSTPGENDLSVDRARSLSEDSLLGGNEACVARQVLSSKSA